MVVIMLHGPNTETGNIALIRQRYTVWKAKQAFQRAVDAGQNISLREVMQHAAIPGQHGIQNPAFPLVLEAAKAVGCHWSEVRGYVIFHAGNNHG